MITTKVLNCLPLPQKLLLFCFLFCLFTEKISAKSIQIGIVQDKVSLHPYRALADFIAYTTPLLTPPLVMIDQNWQWSCVICDAIPTFDNKLAEIKRFKKGKQLVTHWTIKKNFIWGDGKAVSAQDFILGFKIAQAFAIKNNILSPLGMIEAIVPDKSDTQSFSIIFKKPVTDHYKLNQLYPIPAHLEKPVWDKYEHDLEKYLQESHYNSSPLNPGLYNGPFIVEQVNDGIIHLKRNSYNLSGTGHIQKISITLFTTTKALIERLKNQKIDLIAENSLSPSEGIEFINELKNSPTLQKNVKIIFRSSNIYEHIDFNLRNPILADINVRRALLFALDRQKLIETVFSNQVELANNMYSKSDPLYSDKFEKTVFNPAHANELLQKSQWYLNESKKRMKNNTPLKLKIASTDHPVRKKVIDFIKKSWQSLGIELEEQTFSFETFFETIMKHAKYSDMALFSWYIPPREVATEIISSKRIPELNNGYSGQNTGGWRNNNVDRLINLFTKEAAFAKQKSYVEEILQEYSSQVPTIPLYFDAQVAIIPSELEQFILTGHETPSSINAANWKLGYKQTM